METSWAVYGIGFLAQLLFSARTLVQWIKSEKSRTVQSPSSYWILSVAGSYLFMIYGWLRNDFAILFGQFLSYYIYLWNLGWKGIWQKTGLLLKTLLLLTPPVAVFFVLKADAAAAVARFLPDDQIPLPLMICGVAEVDGKGVYTLGVPREGAGWILRCDGEAAAVSDIGEIVSELVSDADEAVFAYATADGRYYQVRDGRKSGLNVSPSGADVVAVKFCGGEASVYTLDEENVLRKDGMELLTFGDSFRLLAVYPDGEHTGAVGYYGDDIYTQYMFLDGEYTEFPENYCLAAVSTGAFSNGHYCLCLNPVEAGLPPLYIRDGETVRLPFNGCFLGLGVSLAYETSAP